MVLETWQTNGTVSSGEMTRREFLMSLALLLCGALSGGCGPQSAEEKQKPQVPSLPSSPTVGISLPREGSYSSGDNYESLRRLLDELDQKRKNRISPPSNFIGETFNVEPLPTNGRLRCKEGIEFVDDRSRADPRSLKLPDIRLKVNPAEIANVVHKISGGKDRLSDKQIIVYISFSGHPDFPCSGNRFNPDKCEFEIYVPLRAILKDYVLPCFQFSSKDVFTDDEMNDVWLEFIARVNALLVHELKHVSHTYVGGETGCEITGTASPLQGEIEAMQAELDYINAVREGQVTPLVTIELVQSEGNNQLLSTLIKSCSRNWLSP